MGVQNLLSAIIFGKMGDFYCKFCIFGRKFSDRLELGQFLHGLPTMMQFDADLHVDMVTVY